jgi:hypothetical protein
LSSAPEFKDFTLLLSIRHLGTKLSFTNIASKYIIEQHETTIRELCDEIDRLKGVEKKQPQPRVLNGFEGFTSSLR